MTSFSEKTSLTSVGTLTRKVCFRENNGQVGDQNGRPRADILFSGTSRGMSFHLSRTGIYYQLSKRELLDSFYLFQKSPSKKYNRKKKENLTLYRLEIQWPGANSNARLEKGQPLPGYDNFYLASCPEGAVNVKSYQTILYKELYKGIDLKYYQKDGYLKYDYLVSAGADYRQIRLSVKGATSIQINSEGALVIKTPLGNMEEDAPLVTQEGKNILAKWVVEGSTVFFDIKGLDPRKSYRIDPLVRIWGTYYGDTEEDYSNATTTDLSGNVYLVGDANSFQNMVTIGAHQTTYGGSLFDAFLIKFTTDGVRLWGTYYGGTSMEESYGCCTDQYENIYMTGYSRSPNNIATPGSHQLTIGGGLDAFLVKFNSAGQRLWGTYYGGSSFDSAYDCMVDANDDVYIVGGTSSTSQIATLGAWQTVVNGAPEGDAFLAKFTNAGVRIWGTYFGGESGDEAYSIAKGLTGNLFITGLTYSVSGIATAGSAQNSHGGIVDIFLAKFNTAGMLQWATYHGGTDYDIPTTCDSDVFGNVYVSGITSSTNGIATIGCWKPTMSGLGDGFLAKYNDLGVLLWSTYYGGEGYEDVEGSTIDAVGFIYINGFTNSLTDLATLDGWQNTYGGGDFDGFLAQFDPAGILQCATYYGGDKDDFGYDCTSDQTGAIYMNGHSFTSGGIAIATSDSWQPELCQILSDAFLVKFDIFSLSVELLELTSQCNGDVPEITWSTGQEDENEYFLLQKSADGISFSTTDTIVSKGNSSAVNLYKISYDEALLYPYVRILQKELNGKEKQAGSIIRVESCSNGFFYASVFPNPAHDFFTLKLSQLSDSSYMSLVNLVGQTVMEQKLNAMETNFSIPFSGGLYFLKIYEKGILRKTLKIVKE